MSTAGQRPRVAVIGAGGHAKVVIATLRALGYADGGVFAESPSIGAVGGWTILGAPVSTGLAGWSHGHIAIGNNRMRQAMAEQFGLEWLALVHPRAFVDDGATIGPGSIVCAGAVVQTGAIIGAHVIVNAGVTVDHDARIGDWVHLSPASSVASRGAVETGAVVGTGAHVMSDASVPAWTTVQPGRIVIVDGKSLERNSKDR